jgi:hypothetical protein
MQDNNIHINELTDVFSESVRQKLEDFEIPVDAACWTEIEASLANSKKKKVIPFWWWLSGGAAVATLTLLFVLQPFGDTGNLAIKTEHKNTKATERKIVSTQKSTVAEMPKTVSALAEKPTQGNRLSKAVNASKAETLMAETGIASGTNVQPTAKENVQPVEVAAIAGDTTASVASNVVVGNDSAVTVKKRFLPNSLTEQSGDGLTAKVKEKDSWLLAASFGPSGATSMAGSPRDFLTLANGEKNLSDVETNYTSVMAPPDFTDKTYNPALSFGLMARRNLGKTFSVESGLMYTYLSSSFKRSDFFTYDATLSLHYLGIPVNLIARFWKSKNWEFYVSGGGMVEKGLRSVYVQHQIMGNQTITTTANTNIDGLQWSVNSGLGLTYKIQPKIGLYFEPKFSYFFENNQPVSTRTDQPVSFGLTAGLRFEL